MASKGEARAKKIPWHGPTVGKGEGCGEREGSHELTANCSACGKRKKERERERERGSTCTDLGAVGSLNKHNALQDLDWVAA